jgi:hypothetical protein
MSRALSREEKASYLGISVAMFDTLQADARVWGLAAMTAKARVSPKPRKERVPLIPDDVQDAFDGVPYLTMPQLAKALRMDLKTLNRHREAGNLPVHIKGTGAQRRHYVCTMNDVAEFYRRTGEASCQSSGSRIVPTTSSTFKLKAIAASGPRLVRMNVKPARSRKRSALKLIGSSKKPPGLDGNQ